jgi:3-phytase
MRLRTVVRASVVPVMATLLVIGGTVTAHAQCASYSKVYVFGDSYVDTGNLFIATDGAYPPSPPYYMGRNSNGPLWVEVMAEELGLPNPAPNLAGGTNYAWSGAETGPGLSDYGLPNVGMQIDSFLDAEHAFQGDELIVFDAGYNDLYFGRGVEEVANNFEDHITKLAAAGGRSFLVATVTGDRSPLVVETLDVKAFRKQLDSLNHLLNQRLKKLAKNLGVKIVVFDLDGAASTVLAHPKKYGLTNVTDGFLTGAGDVGNPDEFFWWDDIHMTLVVQGIVGEEAAEFVSEALAAL